MAVKPLEAYSPSLAAVAALLVDLLHLDKNFRNCTLTIKDNTVFATLNLLYNDEVAALLSQFNNPEEEQPLGFEQYAAEQLLGFHLPLSSPLQNIATSLSYNNERFATIKNYPLLHFGSNLSTQEALKLIATLATAILPEHRVKTLGCMVAISPYYYHLND